MTQTVIRLVIDTDNRKLVDRVKDRIAWAINKMNSPPIFDIQEDE